MPISPRRDLATNSPGANLDMLTKQEALAEYDFVTGRIYPDRLTRATHAHYLPVAEQLLDLYANGIGSTRQQIHQRAAEIFEPLADCPIRRLAGLIKLLDDVSEYESDRGKKAATLRRNVFRAAAGQHPLVEVPTGIFESEQWRVKHQIATDLKLTWSQIERRLFADFIEFHPLKSFAGYNGSAALLARYNVAQVQACLYRASRMTLWAQADLKIIVRAIKLSRLMHTIRRVSEGEYQFVIDGPASTLRPTRRYGVAMAKMIPWLLTCQDWRLLAPISIGSGGQQLALQLTSHDGLSSSKLPAPDYDSEIEAELIEKWNAAPLAGWTLRRESELLFRNQKVFTPDFVATHTTGRQVHVEVLGFWTPEYLRAKVQTLIEFADHPILVLAQENKKESLEKLGLPANQAILWYKSSIPLKLLQQTLQNLSETSFSS